MILEITERFYIIRDLKLRVVCKVSKSNDVAMIKKHFNIIGYYESEDVKSA